MRALLLFFSLIFVGLLSSIDTWARSGDTIACTMEYAPVCGSVQVQCIMAPCNPMRQTFSNSCIAGAAGATDVTSGECEAIVGGDSDEHGCKGSAGYAWDENMKSCIRPWEKGQDLIQWAYSSGLTKYDSVENFGFDRAISRQEAAAMFARLGQGNSFQYLRYASYPDICNIAYHDESSFDSSLKNDIYSACAFGMMRGKNGFFSPKQTLTKAEALAILARTTLGEKLDESGKVWYQNYADKIQALNILTLSGITDFNMAITRGELIEWIHSVGHYADSINNARPLIGKWKLDSFNGKKNITDTISLEFKSTTYNAKICNNINATYSATDKTIQSGVSMSTMMYCDGLMDIENTFKLDGATWGISDNLLTIVTLDKNTFVWKK